jgi:hypothetical protein
LVQDLSYIWATDSEGRKTFSSSNSLLMFGRKLDTAETALKNFDLIHPDDRDAGSRAFLEALSVRGILDHTMRGRLINGSYQQFRFLGIPQYAVDGTFSGLVGVASPEHKQIKLNSLSTILCSNVARKRHNKMPTVAYSVDAVLANLPQFIIDTCIQAGLDSGMFSWKSLNTPVWSRCNSCGRWEGTGFEFGKRAQDHINESKNAWSNLDPFPDVNFSQINDDMAHGDYLGCFIASRFFLGSDDALFDPRYLTKSWLRKHGITESNSIISDACPAMIGEVLSYSGADYYLTDSPDQVVRARLSGVESFMINRPWNMESHLQYRVSSIEEFLKLTVYSDHARLY